MINLKTMNPGSSAPLWIEWTNLSLGLVLAISPWLGSDRSTAIMWNALISGLLIACIAANALGERKNLGGANAVPGLWLLVAPGVLAFSNQNGPTWVCVLTGFVVSGLSGHQLSVLKRLRVAARRRATGHPEQSAIHLFRRSG